MSQKGLQIQEMMWEKWSENSEGLHKNSIIIIIWVIYQVQSKRNQTSEHDTLSSRRQFRITQRITISGSILSNATYKRTSPHAFPKKLERKNTEKQSHHYFLYSFEANPWVKFRNRLYPDNWSCSQTCLIGSLANPTK